jgi:hypothetical protein
MITQSASRPEAEVYKSQLELAETGGKYQHWIAVPPSYVTHSFLHALTSPYPIPRYPVGFDSWFVRFANWILPVRVWEGILTVPYRFSSIASK